MKKSLSVVVLALLSACHAESIDAMQSATVVGDCSEDTCLDCPSPPDGGQEPQPNPPECPNPFDLQVHEGGLTGAAWLLQTACKPLAGWQITTGMWSAKCHIDAATRAIIATAVAKKRTIQEKIQELSSQIAGNETGVCKDKVQCWLEMAPGILGVTPTVKGGTTPPPKETHVWVTFTVTMPDGTKRDYTVDSHNNIIFSQRGR